MKNLKNFLYLFIIFLAIVFSGKALNLLADYFWFQAVGYDPVFLISLTAKFLVWLVFALLFVAFFYSNITLTHSAKENRPEPLRLVRKTESTRMFLKQQTVNLTLLFISVVLGIIMGILPLPSWLMILRFLNQTPFGTTDPLFQKDIGFYVFSLPAYRFLSSWLFLAITTTMISVGIMYIKNNIFSSDNSEFGMGQFLGNNPSLDKFNLPVRAKLHLSILVALLLLLYAFQTRLEMFELLFSTHGAVFGASYTDVHARLGVQWLTLILAVAAAGLFLATLRTPRWKIPFISLGVLVLWKTLLSPIYPEMVQRFLVEPNELKKERSFIENNISYTRQAYNINNIEEKNFAADDSLTINDIEKEKPTIRNIKLWNKRPLKRTYKEIQEMRLYYNFLSVDVDRYQLDGRLTQLMLSPREIIPTLLPQEAHTWENLHLQYTHGYGLVMSPVNHVTPEGLPHLIIKDIPPVSESSLVVTQPEIYYGEASREYSIVKTTTPEFDYPKGDKNAYTHYTGIGGVRLNNLFMQLLYAWEEADPQIFLSSYVTFESRILLRRNIKKRVYAIAPYLDLDQDPYLVLSEGKLYWIMDGYTTSNRYPYSKPFSSYLNYIRNPVKIVVDAYNGSIYFYLVDPTDPIIQTYNNIFPGVFKPFNEMPEDLRRHIRYPKDLFEIQCHMYRTYHMRDPAVFYNREDQWAVPQETEQEQEMRSYYLIMRLPGEKREEFLLFLPFTPRGKNNMIAWMGARCDEDQYGKLIVFKFPKEKLIYGPQQIEARINQDATISKELTLWGQQGSRVIHGDLLIIPINQSLLYVKPLYLQASRNDIPELKRTIVALGNRIVMKDNLSDALTTIFGGKVHLEDVLEETIVSQTSDQNIKKLTQKAYERFSLAEAFLREGNWAEWGKVMEELKNLLNKMKNFQDQSEPQRNNEELREKKSGSPVNPDYL